jgi:2-oxoglutarate dehydrogenase E1 component
MNDFVGFEEREAGPSWGRSNWPIAELDELNLGLDPTQATIEKARAAVAARVAETTGDPQEIRRAAEDSIRAMMLIRTYRVRGHLAADLDPLRLTRREVPADLTAEFHGFSDDDLDRPIWLYGALGLEQATVREIVRILQRNYCGHVGLEYMHINDLEERRFLQERMEGKDAEISFTPEGKQSILTKVIHAEQWEKFLARKYVGTKRFGLDGGESAVPALEAVIKYGGLMGVTEIDVGMAHRGRLNILSNVMGKSAQAIFHEFAGGATNPADVGGSGDVKYHLGTSSDREFEGNKVHLALLPNPSHLEAVDPVVLGKARAVQTFRDDKRGKTVLPMLLHGDAAFAGQGVVWECLSFSGLPGYATGGTIHFIINNQIGFTTSPQFGRSSPYPSDVAKGIQAPILHVNGDDPEAVTFCCKLATEFRQTFGRDVVIDMWCYRRFGHNEGDEPSFTQPLMYAAIKKHPFVSAIYGKKLIDEGVVDQAWIDRTTTDFVAHLEEQFQSAVSYLPNKADWFGGRWAGLGRPDEPVLGRRNIPTAIPEDEVQRLGRVLTTVPDGFAIHKTLQRILDAKKEMFASGDGFDWATAEALAFGSLLADGNGVRLSGQDSGRGTFSQRHAVWVDQQTAQKYIPLTSVQPGHFEDVDEFCALDRIAADADRGRLPKVLVGGLEHRLIGERARAADHPDTALLEDVAGHDADLALIGRQHPRAVGPDQPRLRARERALDLHHVEHRNALRDGDDQRHLGIDRLEDRVRGERRRHVDHAGSRAGLGDRFMYRVEYGQADMLGPAFPGGHARDHLSSVGERLLGMERAGLAGHPLRDDLGAAVDEDAHATASSARLLSICLQATSSSFTASTLTSKFWRACGSSSISTIRSTPPAPSTTGTPT